MNVFFEVWLVGTLVGGTALVFAALGGLLSERSGVVNIGLEGMMLAGAFAGALVGYYTQSATVGVLAAMLAGGVVALLHAVFTQKYKVDHVISGVALNLVALGATNFLLRRAPTEVQDFNFVPSVPWWLLTGLAFALAVGIYVWLNNSVAGIRLQAVGNSGEKAAQMGVNVVATRYFGVVGSGVLAGLGGAFLSLSQTPGFSENMSAGRGYIALAALIIGRWTPMGATLAALAFGLFYQMEQSMQVAPVFGLQLPTEFWLSLPYLLTVVALAGFLGRSRPPADLGNS